MPKKSGAKSKIRRISELTAVAGRLGGQARAANMTPEQRRAGAIKASKAAAEARSKKARKGGQ